MIGYTCALIICDLITWMCLFILYKINRNYYRNAFTLSLSEKYQVAENIRAVRMTFIYIFFITLVNIGCSVILFLQGFYLLPK
uniref:Uncharacterized protein n=1 Tax=Acrobeloides nanus TaxID=290746 RepID=A0A914DB01_9BILA